LSDGGARLYTTKYLRAHERSCSVSHHYTVVQQH
jgi:hypothetical protein